MVAGRGCQPIEFLVLALLTGTVQSPCAAAQNRGTIQKPAPAIQALLDAGAKAEKAATPRLDEAERLFTEALKAARNARDAVGESEALRNLGNLSSDRGQTEKALEYYQQSLGMSRKIGDMDGQGLALLDMAILYRGSDPARALPLCRQAVALFQEAGNKKREADTLTILGTALAATEEYAPAQRAYLDALALYQAIGEEQAQGNVLFFLGNLHPLDSTNARSGQITSAQAREYYERAIPFFHKANNLVGEGQLNTFVAGLLVHDGRLDEARDYFERALVLLRQAGVPEQTAYGLKELSTILSIQGRLVESLKYDQEALEIYRASGNRAGEANQLLHIGNIYTRLGQQQTALQIYLQALPLLEATGDTDNLTTTLHGIGEIYNILGDRKRALEYFKRAIPLLEKPAPPMLRQRNLNILAGIYFLTGSLEKAHNTLEENLANLRKAGDSVGIATTISMLALVDRGLKNPARALERYREELRLTEGSGDLLGKAQTLGSIAELEEEQGDLTGAERHFREAVSLMEQVRTSLSGLSEAKSTFLTANIGTYREYLALLLRMNRPVEAFALAQKMKARALLDILFDGKVQIAASLTPEERAREKFLRERSDALNYQLVREGVENEVGSRRRAEAIKSQIAEAERELRIFEDSLYARRPDIAKRRAARTVTLPEAAKFLPEDTALLEYVTLSVGKLDETVLFVVTRKGVNPTLSVHILPVKQSALSLQVGAMREACSDPRRSYRAASTQLYRSLISPAEAQIAGKKRLLICPDQLLWDTPFAALLKGDRMGAVSRTGERRRAGGFLVERFEIAYAYSATGADAAIGARRDARRHDRASTLLAFANPAFGDEKRFGDNPEISGQRPIAAPSRPLAAPSRPLAAPSRPLAAPSRPLPAPSRPLAAPSRDIFLPRGGRLAELPGTQQEADAIRADFPVAAVYTREQAQESTAKRLAGKYRYLHFATHGFFNDAAPLLSAIVLAVPDKVSGDDGFLTAREIFDLDLHADMAVLSACNTARGEKRSGEGVIGLTWALFAAGAPTQIVSQWSVNDASTAQLMRTFYANLTRGHMAKGRALRQAALSLLRSGNAGTVRRPSWQSGRKRISRGAANSWTHPYYWAPFILMGDWR